MRWIGIGLGIGMGLAVSGCCDGPFVAVDCVGMHRIELVDAAGGPMAADRLVYTIDGGAQTELPCASSSGTDTGAPSCTEFYLPLTEGTYAVQAFVGDTLVGEGEHALVRPDRELGECCSDAIAESFTLQIGR